MLEHVVVLHHLHAASAQHVGRTHHQRIADLGGNFQRLFQGAGHARFGLGDAQFAHDLAEAVAVLGQVDGVRGGAQNLDPGLSQFAGDVQRGLAAELNDHAFGFFLFVDAQHIFHGQRFEIELVGGVVVGGNGFRIAVDHDRLIAGVPDGKAACTQQ